MALIATSDLLTLKKTIYVANLSEDEVNTPEQSRHYMAVKQLADEEGSLIIPICAKLEADIAELDDPEEKAMFMEELGVKESGLDHQEGHQGPQAAFEANHNFYVRIHSICFLLVLYRQFDSALDVQRHHFVGITLYISLYMFIFNSKFCY